MKILVVGAGALGGYFGGRLALAGRDVTFLVRSGRAGQLAATGGLAIKSPAGDALVKDPKLVRARDLDRPYDLVIVSCKAFALESCLADFAPAVGPETMILPVLNGLCHLDALAARFGRERVLGGRCFIFASLDPEGRVLHQGALHGLDFGELAGGVTPRVERVAAELSGAGFDASLNPAIMLGMWEKWVLIAALAGGTSMMRAAIGDVVRAGGLPVTLALLKECAGIAAAAGFAPSEKAMANATKILSAADSPQMASMAKDIEKGLPIEADHILGDLVARIPAGTADAHPLIRLAYLHTKCYEARRAREGAKNNEQLTSNN